MTHIHPTAIVHARAKLGEGVSIGAYSLVGEHVEIGDNTAIGPHAFSAWCLSSIKTVLVL